MSADFREELVQTFREYSTDDLLEKLRAGTLIELAQDVAKQELRARGVEFTEQLVVPEAHFDDAPIRQEEFETVASFANTTDAHILQSRLEAEGIPVFIADAYIGVANAFLLSGTSNIRVQVPKSLIPQAREIILAIQEDQYSLDHSSQSNASSSTSEQPSLSLENAFSAFFQDPVWMKIWQERSNKSGVWMRFNPFAAVFGIVWFFYRKMYVLGAVVLVADWIAASILGPVGVLVLVRLPVGVLANILYYKKAEKAVRLTQTRELPKDDLIQGLKQQGGISIPGALFALIAHFGMGLLLAPLSELLH